MILDPRRCNVILEGCDCVGKTTIANELTKHGFMPPRHAGPPSNKYDAICDYVGIIKDLNSQRGIVLDRAWLGETVYGPLKRNYDTSVIIRSLETLLEPHNILVLVTAEPSVVENRFDGKFIGVNEIEDVLNSFYASYSFSNAPLKMVVDTSFSTPKEIVDEIKNVCEVHNIW